MSELTRCVRLDELPSGGLAMQVDADAGERLAVARRLDLLELGKLQTRLLLTRGPRREISILQGTLEAEVRQRCVVTLEPVDATIVQGFERYFVVGEVADDEEVVIGIEDEEPEPLTEPMLDVGELIVEELALALDPYPRSGEADEVMRQLGGAQENERQPFSSLSRLHSPKSRPQSDEA